MPEWTTAYVNDLPDSSFAIILPGGHKDADGRTVPRDLRRLPYKDTGGHLDRPHLANALSRLAQTNLTAAQQDKARRVLESAAEAAGVGDRSADTLPPSSATRDFAGELYLRDGGDGRTIEGRLVPFGVVTEVRDEGGPPYRERFWPGAFAAQIRGGQPQRVRLYAQHPRQNDRLPIGAASELRETRDALVGSFRLPAGHSGADDALALVRAGVVDGFSIGFQMLAGGSVRSRDGVVERRRAHVQHVALTDSPAYDDARITAVRAAELGAAPHPAGSGLAHYRGELARLRAAVT